MYLLDTHVLLWLADKQEELSREVLSAIGKSASKLFISSITGFEIAVKAERGALSLPLPPGTWIQKALELHGIEEIPVTCAIAAFSAALPKIHRDPCDRIIIATARHHELTVLTKDPVISRYPDVRVLW
ncbi:MAG: type II toxin-antitoxin system VapC family toxin [Planctomycetes bacterium]|nr:type II toxin-antitoxin system VapC family toxin [Planctomycetota bacterium]